MISILSLSKKFGSHAAIEDVFLEICDGETVVLQGPSGSGKTTLLRLIAGLEVPDDGEIFFDGKLASSPKGVLPPYQREVGIVFQRSALWPHMTVAKNILFCMDGKDPGENRRYLNWILQELELSELVHRYPSQLSGGEARRVALGRALARKAKYLLLDEPLTSLNPELKARLLQVILHAKQDDGAALLYITHDIEEARSIGGRLVQLKMGRLAV